MGCNTHKQLLELVQKRPLVLCLDLQSPTLALNVCNILANRL